MHRSTLILSIGCAVLLFGCAGLPVPAGSIRGSGKIATRDYALTGFTGVDACCGYIVHVSGGDRFKVTVATDDNVLDALVVEKQGDNLRLAFDTVKFPSVQTTQLQAEVTLPSLQTVTLSGGSRLTLAGAVPGGTALTVTASGGAEADLAGMAVQKASVNLSGGARAAVNVTGSLDYDLSTGAHLDIIGHPTIGIANVSGGASAASK